MKEHYQKAWEREQLNYHSNPMTGQISEKDLVSCISWADWISSKFQRASSAVEGRNGYLSQMHHNGRGMKGNRLPSLTVVHNYDLKRLDGTTAAERLFQVKPPDLFEWILEKIEGLPAARKSRKRKIHDPLIIKDGPA